MQRSKPFARAIAMMAAISAALSAGMSMPGVLAGMGEYKSRGHGIGKHSGKKWGPSSTGKYVGVFNGRRECERRMRQMARDTANQERRMPALDERFAIEA